MRLLKEYVQFILKGEDNMSYDHEKPPGGGIVVVRQFDDGWRVLCLHTEDFMDLPKGGIDPGEDVLSTALRETQEEANITDLRFSWGFKTVKLNQLTMFLAETKQDPEITPNPHTGVLEHLGASWLGWNEAYSATKPWLAPSIEWARKIIEKQAA